MKSQIEISLKSGIHVSHLNKILAGHKSPSWQTAKKLAAATGLDPIDWLELPPDELRRKLGLPAKRPYRRKTEEVA